MGRVCQAMKPEMAQREIPSFSDAGAGPVAEEPRQGLLNQFIHAPLFPNFLRTCTGQTAAAPGCCVGLLPQPCNQS